MWLPVTVVDGYLTLINTPICTYKSKAHKEDIINCRIQTIKSFLEALNNVDPSLKGYEIIRPDSIYERGEALTEPVVVYPKTNQKHNKIFLITSEVGPLMLRLPQHLTLNHGSYIELGNYGIKFNNDKHLKKIKNLLIYNHSDHPAKLHNLNHKMNL
jgi:hypothetical protein